MSKLFMRLRHLLGNSINARYYYGKLHRVAGRLDHISREYDELNKRFLEAVKRLDLGESEELAESIMRLEKNARRLSSLYASTEALLMSAGANRFPTPPRLGERLLLLILTKEERVNIPGDLEEEFTEIAAKHGERYAKLWYYKQVAASAWPMLRKAVGWGLLASIGAWIRRLI